MSAVSDGEPTPVSGEEIARIIDEACSGAPSYVAISGRLNDQVLTLSGGDDLLASALAPFINAFSYELCERNSERREEYGPFVPMFEWATHSFPPPVRDVEPEQALAWAEIHGLVHEPAARARLGDLLWTKRATDQPHLYARDAVAAYREVAEQWADLDAGDALMRSLELALQLEDADEAQLTAARIVRAAQVAIAESDQKPGVSLRLLQSLVAMPLPPGEVDDLLEQAEARYRANIHVGDSIAAMRGTRAGSDQAAVERIRRELLQRWLDYAAASDPLVALHHLQHGLELAKTFGMADEQRRFRLALQELDRETIDFERIEAEASVDREAIESLVESFVQPSWSESLLAFGATGPPTGDVTANEEMIRQLMVEHPIAFLFANTVLGPENTIITNGGTDEDKFTIQLAQHEERSIIFWGHLSVEALRRMVERLGQPDPDELTRHFTRGIIAPEIADSFARALTAYCQGRYDESTLILAARTEAAIRELARQAGLVVNKEPDGVRPGGVRSLGVLLQGLEPRFADHSWWRYLWNALTEPLGMNLRNRLAHGLMEGSQLTAAVLLHVACFLTVLTPTPPTSN